MGVVGGRGRRVSPGETTRCAREWPVQTDVARRIDEPSLRDGKDPDYHESTPGRP